MHLTVVVNQVSASPPNVEAQMNIVGSNGSSASGVAILNPNASVADLHEGIAAAARQCLRASGENVADTDNVTLFGSVVKV